MAELISYTDKITNIRQPRKYLLAVGRYWEGDLESSYGLSRMISMQLIGIEGPIRIRPKNLTGLLFEQCYYKRNPQGGLCVEASPKLFKILNWRNLRYLFSWDCSPSFFKSVEDIRIDFLKDLEALFGGGRDAAAPIATQQPLYEFTFCSLTKFCLIHCHRIEKIFHPELLTNLKNLEEIDVSYCNHLEEIIAGVEEQAASSSNTHSSVSQATQFCLPKLRVFKLVCIDELTSIFNAPLQCPSLQKITICSCKKLKKISICLPIQSLQVQVYPKKWWQTLQWGDADQKAALQPIFL